jgi:D-alanine-D-alanine ligase
MSFPSNLKVWVLAPFVESSDENISYYYDFSQSIEEYTKVFTELNIVWQWQPVTLENYQIIINSIVEESAINNFSPLVFNLCDGDELNGTPGISVIRYLDKLQLKYTGADEYFYHITTSKADMKKAFDEHNVCNAPWKSIESFSDIDDDIFKTIGTPIIVKPAISGGSMGVGKTNVVHSVNELKEQVNKMFEGYRGWNLNAGGIIAEAFITGPEFTVFITGNYDDQSSAHIYTPVERVFHQSLSDEEKFLSFDRLWEIYEEEDAMPNEENFYEYQLPKTDLIESIKQLSWNAYVACKGKGYTRVDIRMNSKTNELFVLEANAQCGISDDENFTSIGAILKHSNISFTSLVKEIIENSLK